jgi:RHS repeat-associated protein
MSIIATANADGTIREYFTRGIGIAGDVGSLIAETRFENNAPVSTAYLHSNWRGDVVMAVSENGAVVGSYDYTTFGEQLSVSGAYTPRFTFSSKERDASGLVYFGFRYYSPVLCRWISEDPIREQGGFNLYQFTKNNPVNLIDPHGLDNFWGSSGQNGVANAGIQASPQPAIPQQPRHTGRQLMFAGHAFLRVPEYNVSNQFTGQYFELHYWPAVYNGGISSYRVDPEWSWGLPLWTRNTTPEEDKAILDRWYYYEQNPPDSYNLYKNNCWTTSWNEFFW